MNPHLSSSGPYTLTVHLERRGPALDIRYYLPGMEAIASVTRNWQDALVARGDPKGALFELLFGAETEWEPVFRRLFQQTRPPTPAQSDSRAGAPAHLHRGTAAAGLAVGPDHVERLPIDRPESGLGIHDHRCVGPDRGWRHLDPLPGADRRTAWALGAPDPHHPQVIEEALRQIWPTGHPTDYLRCVRARAELENALYGMRPHLVYVYACGSRTDNQPGLLLADGWLSLSELAGWFKQYPPPPAVVFLNVTGLTDSGLTPARHSAATYRWWSGAGSPNGKRMPPRW